MHARVTKRLDEPHRIALGHRHADHVAPGRLPLAGHVRPVAELERPGRLGCVLPFPLRIDRFAKDPRRAHVADQLHVVAVAGKGRRAAGAGDGTGGARGSEYEVVLEERGGPGGGDAGEDLERVFVVACGDGSEEEELMHGDRPARLSVRDAME